MLNVIRKSIAAAAVAGVAQAQSGDSVQSVRNVVLVHGAFADGSGLGATLLQ